MFGIRIEVTKNNIIQQIDDRYFHSQITKKRRRQMSDNEVT